MFLSQISRNFTNTLSLARCTVPRIQTRTCFTEAEMARRLDPIDRSLVPPPNDMKIVKHTKRIPKTAPGRYQAPPTEKQEYQMYDYVEDPIKEHPPVKVILLKSVDGIGIRGDVVTVPSDDYHNVLFPSGCAIYATPYDLRILQQQKLAGEFSKLSPEDMLSYRHKKLARRLHQNILTITMTFDEKWTLEKRHIRINLRRQGFMVNDEHIVMPEQPISGPNKNLQEKLITFYVKHTPHCIVPVLGRIDQVSSKGHQIIVSGKDAKGAIQMDASAPPIYYSAEPLNLTDDEIRSVMLSHGSKSSSLESMHG